MGCSANARRGIVTLMGAAQSRSFSIVSIPIRYSPAYRVGVFCSLSSIYNCLRLSYCQREITAVFDCCAIRHAWAQPRKITRS